ncbi:MAG: sel1 repeat family protein [Rhodospirillaceae bacterium]|nr:sel1 repeat family protein [Rhodospirillaceae bacterium]MBT5458287.1 sel1 repeat family protein [Rhodospirillaceae bacterium]
MALLLTTGGLAEAGDFDTGLVAFKQGDHATALRMWKPLAERGDRAAQYNLGLLQESGKGLPPDRKAALAWYEKSAAQGFPMALHNLGRLYYMGDGVTEDYAKAIKHFVPAAEQGVAFSHFFLGMIYAGGGGGVQADHIQSYKRLSLAAALHTSEEFRRDALSSRKILAKGMSSDKIAVAERLAQVWLAAFKKRTLLNTEKF